MQKKYIDYTVYGKDFQKTEEVPTHIRISMKGESIGAHFITGLIANYIAKNHGGFSEVGSVMSEMSKHKTHFYFDDLLKANEDDLINPGVMVMLGADAASFMPDKWAYTFTNCIETAE